MGKPLVPLTDEEIDAEIARNREFCVAHAKRLILNGESREFVFHAMMTRARERHLASYYLCLAEQSL